MRLFVKTIGGLEKRRCSLFGLFANETVWLAISVTVRKLMFKIC